MSGPKCVVVMPLAPALPLVPILLVAAAATVGSMALVGLTTSYLERRKLEARFGDVRLAVAAYNLGPERVAGMRPDRARRTDYVRRVLRRWARTS